MCKLRGSGNVPMLLLLGRSFHEVKKSSCPSPVTAPTDTTQRDTSGMKRPFMKSTCMCTVSSSWRTFSLE
ncbi:unnamed protein product [Sphagnum jensenii]|uniref:Secreted protein n=1 Tax=Sphagnum jensenii TaxID=128206 RepID=A0ABP1AF83_9BRYO